MTNAADLAKAVRKLFQLNPPPLTVSTKAWDRYHTKRAQLAVGVRSVSDEVFMAARALLVNDSQLRSLLEQLRGWKG
jgi:hypothetical protein